MKKVTLLLIIFTALLSCRKEHMESPFTPVSFKTTEYNYMGTYDTLGKPVDNLLAPDILSPELIDFIKISLPDQTNINSTNPSLLSSNSDLSIKQKSDVYITFVSESAGSLNTLGFYTYSTNSPPQKPEDIKTIKYMFPNASLVGWNGGGLKSGDKIKLGSFDAGTSIGFVLLEKGWNTKTKAVDSKANHFCSNEILNPENDPSLKKHTVLLNYPKENKIFIGFEDEMRTDPTCDHDFNDVVIYASFETPSL